MDAARTAIAVACVGAEAEAAARTLRGIGGVEVAHITGASEEELLEQLSRDDLDAVAFVTPVADLAGSLRRALMTNHHALVIGPAALAAAQFISLDDLARRRSRVVYVDNGYGEDERLVFTRKMTASSGALWRPRYVRAVRTGPDRHGLNDLAIADIGCVLSIMGLAPSRVSAVAPRIDDETGHADAVMITMTFDGGPVATLDLSLVEAMPRREISVVCDGRTIMLDALDARAPLQIQASGRHRGPQPASAWSETVSEYPTASGADRPAAVADAFVAAVRARDLAAINLRELAVAAATWEAARESIARGGELIALAADASAPRPALQVIHGAGRSRTLSAPPDLTLIRRRNA